MKGHSCTANGSALLLVFWALLLLSAAVLAWTEMIQNGITIHGEENRGLEARAMAQSGLALGLHPLVSRLTSLPAEELSPGVGFKVRIGGEGAKLNLNWLLRGEEPRKLMILKQWLERRGLSFEQRETFVDCLLDYVDADNIQRLNGREDDGSYHPANRELRSVEELSRVSGTAPLTSQAGWQDDLTVYSQGPIDLASASAEILALLPGLSEIRIRQFVQYRQGPDGIDGTADDQPFANLGAIQQFLGLTSAQFGELGSLVNYQDSTLRVISEGHSGNVTRQMIVIVRKGGSKPQILSWKE